MTELRLGTRASPLAIWQAEHVAVQLEAAVPGLRVELKRIRTSGDRNRRLPLAGIGGQGLFTRQLERALLERRIDLAVHSCKDLTSTLPPRLMLGAIPLRGPVEDVLVTKNGWRLYSLPSGATVATGSLRRRAQLLHLRPDLSITGIRGNLQTRVRKLDASSWEAVVVARAGLERLAMGDCIGDILPPSLMVPAAGQGALAVEIRDPARSRDKMDREIAGWVRRIEHGPSAVAVHAERALLRTVGGGCNVPIGAFAELAGGRLRLEAVVSTGCGRRLLRDVEFGDPEGAEELGVLLGERLLSCGADRLLAAAEDGDR